MSLSRGWCLLVLAESAACSSSGGASVVDTTGDAGDAAAPPAAPPTGSDGGPGGGTGTPTCPTAQQKTALETFIRSNAIDGDVAGFTVPFTSFGFPELLAANQGKPSCTTFSAGSASGGALVQVLASDNVIASAYLRPIPVSLTGTGGDVLVSNAMQTADALDDSGGATTTQNQEHWKNELTMTPPGLPAVRGDGSVWDFGFPSGAQSPSLGQRAPTLAAGTCACRDAGRVACDGACVDVANDRYNCGACHHICETSTCAGGVCN